MSHKRLRDTTVVEIVSSGTQSMPVPIAYRKKDRRVWTCPINGLYTIVGCNLNSPHQPEKLERIQMAEKDLSELTDEELLQEAKKMKSRSTINALTIGIMVGVIFWSVVNSTVGLFTLIPLFFIYKLVNNSKDDKALKELLRERNLK